MEADAALRVEQVGPPVVEVNNTFYMLPKEDTFVRWRQESADGFLFVVKASRYITHIPLCRPTRE